MRYIFLTVVIALSCASPADADVKPISFDRTKALLERYCTDCHNADAPEADLDLTAYGSVDAVVAARPKWEQVLHRVRNGEMPPDGSEAPTLDERDELVEWIETALRSAACAGPPDPGPTPIRRLNRSEYRNTIRDLLGVHFDAAHALPADGAGGAGFDNAAETLFLSPVHAEKYLDAAREALDYAAKDVRSRKRLIIARPDEKTSADDAARKVLSRFTLRAFRRPPTDREIERLLTLYRTAADEGTPFDDAIMYAMQAVLISPHFLFRVEQIPEGTRPQPVDDYELATRLSYFLWGSMPDDRLLDLARKNELHKDDVLRAETLRMLKDRKARGLAESFVGQWLGTRSLGVEYQPDPEVFRRYRPELESAMKEEPVVVFLDILRENHSLLTLIDADFTYVNLDLARHYGIDKKIEGGLRQQLRKVDLPEDSHRGGVLTMAAVLAVSSYPDRTSPVLRGQWLLSNILGTPSPPPPPDVPELSEDEDATSGKTLRERLLAHRANPTCASCHDRLDPLGFGLENFDAIGRWRTTDNEQPIDASGALPGGLTFNGPDELKQVLLQRKDETMRHLTTKMLAFALGRGLVNEDYCTVDQIMERLAANEYRAQELLLGIVESVPFRQRRGRDHKQPALSTDVPATTGEESP
ncbi:Planctomycete cytochrome C [Maioricimonas rarisocia]|uniref:Planctomycete cytochrome C n=1 Tax=Maioricimonas rarisocia TaxID=2528026 RepID=A0A517ZC28_9PLAN|nr:DUF1592 domain-containing protein [Maioricimonas rarisocia]QDU40053.1 Planctomycete cytochrome C [Maioricimonas rarisocia]